MPYVPNDAEYSRLRTALDRSAFSEGERIFWLIGFVGWVALCGLMLAMARTWVAVAAGGLGAFFGFSVLYYRLRAAHLNEMDRELHGIGLRTEAQRAFTALMFRQALTGANPLRPRNDHDPIAAWEARTAQLASGEEIVAAEEG